MLSEKLPEIIVTILLDRSIDKGIDIYNEVFACPSVHSYIDIGEDPATCPQKEALWENEAISRRVLHDVERFAVGRGDFLGLSHSCATLYQKP